MNRTLRTLRMIALGAAAVVLLCACPVTLVQPYDEKLFSDTESLFKKASAMIDDGWAKSPITDDDRAAIKARADAAHDPKLLTDHPAHLSKFEARYNELSIDADVLILRALAKSQPVGALGEKVQKKVETLIEQNLPSACPEMDAEFATLTSSLTVHNYIDLKCILVRWKAQHADPGLTRGTQILRRANWELRKSTLFAAVLTIQTAEASKKK